MYCGRARWLSSRRRIQPLAVVIPGTHFGVHTGVPGARLADAVRDRRRRWSPRLDARVSTRALLHPWLRSPERGTTTPHSGECGYDWFLAAWSIAWGWAEDDWRLPKSRSRRAESNSGEWCHDSAGVRGWIPCEERPVPNLSRQLESSRQSTGDQWPWTPHRSRARLGNGVAPRKRTRRPAARHRWKPPAWVPVAAMGAVRKSRSWSHAGGREIAWFRPRRRPSRFYPRFADRRQGQLHISKALPIPGARDTTPQFNRVLSSQCQGSRRNSSSVRPGSGSSSCLDRFRPLKRMRARYRWSASVSPGWEREPMIRVFEPRMKHGW